MSNIPTPGQVYRHFKGNLYRVVTLAEHSETKETLVIYQALYGEYKVYARPLSMFLEQVDGRKYPENAGRPRFELQKELIGASADSAPVRGCSVEGESAEEPLQAHMQKEPCARKPESAREEETASAKDEEKQEELNIDPLVLDFLDARTYRERLRILSELHPRITDDMINIMAISADVEIKDGDTEKRFEELRTCLLTFERYESNSSRLR